MRFNPDSGMEPEPNYGQEAVKERAYYEASDAKRAQCVRRAAEEPPLVRLLGRVEGLTHRMLNELGEITDQLDEHSDRVHGAEPACGTPAMDNVAEDFGPGVLGHLFRAVENLEEQYSSRVSSLRRAARRGTTLA